VASFIAGSKNHKNTAAMPINTSEETGITSLAKNGVSEQPLPIRVMKRAAEFLCEFKQSDYSVDAEVIDSSSEEDDSSDDEVSIEEKKPKLTDTKPCIIVDSDEENTEEKPPKPKLKRPTCEMCDKEESKYTCPGCTLMTCSLPCVKAHKVKLNCTGERDKTAFVDMSQYGDLNLLSDYRFLEDAERSIYSHKALTVPHGRHMHKDNKPYHLSKRSKLLITAAQKRGIKLKMLPLFLSKNKDNTSFYVIKVDVIEWYVVWLFVTSESIVKVNEQRVKESVNVTEAAEKFTNPLEFPHLRKSLEDFNKDNMSSCQFLLKLEGFPANRPRYFKVDSSRSLKNALQGQCMTEHPSVYIVPESYKGDQYVVISKEDVSHMAKDNVRHMSTYHPDMRVWREEQEATLMNPQSDIYAAA